jgi:hypothetical protein
MSPQPSKLLTVVIGALLMVAIGWLDYANGYQLNLLILYAFPLAWVAWSVNFSWAFGLSVADTLAKMWTDSHWVHPYQYAWIPWERAAMRMIMLGFISFSFHQFRRDLDSKARKVRQLEGILPVCIGCNRISEGTGQWVDLGTYLQRHSSAKPETQLCPECTGLRYR